VKENWPGGCRAFIVEAENTTSKMQVIDVQEFDLKRGIEKLLE